LEIANDDWSVDLFLAAHTAVRFGAGRALSGQVFDFDGVKVP